RRWQVARRPVRRRVAGLTGRAGDDLPGDVRDRHVPVPLPAGPGPLGHAAEHTGVARRRPAGRPDGPRLAGYRSRGRVDVGPVAAGRRPPGGPGPPAGAARRRQGAQPGGRALLPAAPGALLGAVPGPPVRVPPPAARPGPAEAGLRTPAAERPPPGGLLGRG